MCVIQVKFSVLGDVHKSGPTYDSGLFEKVAQNITGGDQSWSGHECHEYDNKNEEEVFIRNNKV